MKYKSKKGTVINIPDGLSAQQIASIKADADAGYGTRAQATANKLGKSKTTTTAGDGTLNGVVSTSGTVDPSKANAAVAGDENKDVNTNFQLEHPTLITDANGNTREITRHADGTVTVRDTKGGAAQTFTNMALATAGEFNGAADRKKAEEATYNTITRDYERDKGREMEAAKQEMANRGIPYDPAAAQDRNTTNLYGRTIGGIDQKYQGLKDNAQNQSVLAGNSAYQTTSSARDSFLNAVTNGAQVFGGNFGQYGNSTTTNASQDTKDILTLSADAYMKKYAIDQDSYNKKLALAKSGGSGNSSSGGSGGGFEIVG